MTAHRHPHNKQSTKWEILLNMANQNYMQSNPLNRDQGLLSHHTSTTVYYHYYVLACFNMHFHSHMYMCLAITCVCACAYHYEHCCKVASGAEKHLYFIVSYTWILYEQFPVFAFSVTSLWFLIRTYYGPH